jgi:hypothetical protein
VQRRPKRSRSHQPCQPRRKVECRCRPYGVRRDLIVVLFVPPKLHLRYPGGAAPQAHLPVFTATPARPSPFVIPQPTRHSCVTSLKSSVRAGGTPGQSLGFTWRTKARRGSPLELAYYGRSTRMPHSAALAHTPPASRARRPRLNPHAGRAATAAREREAKREAAVSPRRGRPRLRPSRAGRAGGSGRTPRHDSAQPPRRTRLPQGARRACWAAAAGGHGAAQACQQKCARSVAFTM